MQKIRTVLKHWLIHAAIMWVLQNIAAAIFAIYKSRNVIKELGELNFDQPTIPIILLAILLVEVNKNFLFKKQILFFLMGSYISGLLTSFVIISLSPAYSLELNILVNEPTFVVAFYAFTYPLIFDFINKKIFRSQLLYEESQAELNALKGQVNPHFLFNSLNSIYALAIQENAERTGEAIAGLSDMMRHVLEVQQEEHVKLEKEVEFIEQFIELQKLRLSKEDQAGVKFRKQITENDLKVPHLVFLPLLENAFKYGISSKIPAEIDIELDANANSVKFKIQNRIMNEKSGLGTGLKNLKKRLDLTYGNKYELTTTKEQDSFIVKLSIKL